MVLIIDDDRVEMMKNNIHDEVKKKLADKEMCYILITCSIPEEENGKLNVEMSYDGEPALASYLLQGAQNFFEDQEDEKNGCRESYQM